MIPRPAHEHEPQGSTHRTGAREDDRDPRHGCAATPVHLYPVADDVQDLQQDEREVLRTIDVRQDSQQAHGAEAAHVLTPCTTSDIPHRRSHNCHALQHAKQR